MSVTILLLRGINVGGKHRLPMADLKDLARSCGAEEAAHYLQSGNLAVTGTVDPDHLSDAIMDAFGFRPLVMARSLAHWRGVVAANPYPDVREHKAVHVFSLAGPSATTAADLLGKAGPEEQVTVTPSEVYLHTPKFLSGSKIAERMDRLMGVATTARNWRSVGAILKLGESLA